MKNLLFRCFLFLNIVSITFAWQVENIFASNDFNTIYDHFKYKYENKISESGIKTTITYDSDVNIIAKSKELYNLLPLKNKENIYVEEIKLDNGYIINFENEVERGTIQYIDTEHILVFEYMENKYENNINEVRNYLKDFGASNNIFEYSKIFFENGTEARIKDEIVQNIKQKQGKNINITSLNNGYSVTGFGGDSNNVRVLNSLIDFNCSITKYNSRVEVIFATPVILKTY